MSYRAGDVLRIWCPFTAARVTGVHRDHVSVRWPWWTVDPDGGDVRWNGDVAVGRDDPEELYATEPPPGSLTPGTTCRVGMPPRLVHVVEVRTHDPAQPTGWLPRPTMVLTVLPAGVQPDPAADREGVDVEVDGGVPMTFERVFRPYAFLEHGDEVADAAGRAWRFDGVWSWTAYDGGDGTPEWPLILLAGSADPATVAAATAAGSHDEETAHLRHTEGRRPPG